MGKVVDFMPYLLKKKMSKPKADIVVIYPEITLDLDMSLLNQNLRELVKRLRKETQGREHDLEHE
jgi:hypothetical protein